MLVCQEMVSCSHTRLAAVRLQPCNAGLHQLQYFHNMLLAVITASSLKLHPLQSGDASVEPIFEGSVDQLPPLRRGEKQVTS